LWQEVLQVFKVFGLFAEFGTVSPAVSELCRTPQTAHEGDTRYDGRKLHCLDGRSGRISRRARAETQSQAKMSPWRV